LGGFLGLRGNALFRQSYKSMKSPQITVKTKFDIVKAYEYSGGLKHRLEKRGIL